MSRQHELTALKTAGVSLYRVSLPILLLAFGVSVGAGVFQETLLPVLNSKGEEVDRIRIRGELPRHLQRRTQIWYRSSESRFFRVDLLGFDYLLVESTGRSDPLPIAEPRLGRRTVLTLPLLPPPQKN